METTEDDNRHKMMTMTHMALSSVIFNNSFFCQITYKANCSKDFLKS